MQNTIIAYLMNAAFSRPHQKAFIFLNNQLETEKAVTYSELAAKVISLARKLTLKNLKDHRLLLLQQDTLEFITSFLACQYSGIVAVPMPYVKGRKQYAGLSKVIQDAQVAAALCSGPDVPGYQELFAGSKKWGVEIIGSNIDDCPDENLQFSLPSGNEIAFIQYTSGSTGNPKGVVITSSNLLSCQQSIKTTFGCNEASLICSWLPFYHDMGLIGNILHAIYVGCTCILIRPLDFIQRPQIWLNAISKFKVTHSGAPNFAYDMCVDKVAPEELSKLDLSSWKVAFNGSEPIVPATLQRFSDHFQTAGFDPGSFSPCYGLAEATLLVSGVKENSLPLYLSVDDKVVVSSGKIVFGMEVKIISQSDQSECDELEQGEICIAGPNVTNGYWNRDNSDMVYRAYGKPFLKTGDTGFLHKGHLFVLGRIKEMFIIRGKNIYPYDIEQIVSASDTAIETNGVVAFSYGTDDDKLIIVAEVKRTSFRELNQEGIFSSIENAVIGYFGIAPYEIILTTPLAIPRTTSGKLQRIKCKTDYHAGMLRIIHSKHGKAADKLSVSRDDELLLNVIQSPNYSTVYKYLLDVIRFKGGHMSPGVLNDNIELTGLGLDSLKMTQLANLINQELSTNIEASKIFQCNTLSNLVNMIENILWLKNVPSTKNGIEL